MNVRASEFHTGTYRRFFIGTAVAAVRSEKLAMRCAFETRTTSPTAVDA
jgi:hypothetical protein